MSKHVKIRKGVDIKLQGTAEKVFATVPSETYVIKPTDFHGRTPKLLVKVGDDVKAGSPLFYDKYNEKVKFTSPVSGEVVEINRGEKRRILEIKILADKEVRYENFKVADPASMSREEVLEVLLDSGCWPFIRQRPYSVVADPNETPKAIFISAFDSSPMAPDNDFVVHGKGEVFQKGLDVIKQLTNGKVHLNISKSANRSEVFTQAKGVQINTISGPHPAGNVGVQIHHIDPINKGERVWYLNPQDVLIIGSLFQEGKFKADRIVALTGSEVSKPKYFKTTIGASVKNILQDNVQAGNNRVISGNALTGEKISSEGFIGFYDSQITVLPEGDKEEFFGWLIPSPKKFSLSRTFFSWMTPGKEYRLSTISNGEERAYVVSGEYEKVFPMDIYPVHLIKAIMVEDVELMENLGIYEVAPEDFALCEFACTSKIDVQTIVREGLDLVQKECG